LNDTLLTLQPSSVLLPGYEYQYVIGDITDLVTEDAINLNDNSPVFSVKSQTNFDISDLAFPVQVGDVQTCRGSHTHSVVSGPSSDGKILVYNSGTSRIRDQEELETCFDSTPGDTRTSLFRIDVIEIPLDDPSKARIIDSPTVFADSETGSLAGLLTINDSLIDSHPGVESNAIILM